ncbi:MAG: agmatine deiminase family protein, partial [Acidimicrobiaceae bacterium]
MPAEFSRHERTVICWPARSEIYGSRLAEAQTAHAALANTLSGYNLNSFSTRSTRISNVTWISNDRDGL